jgi:hypothetical protein
VKTCPEIEDPYLHAAKIIFRIDFPGWKGMLSSASLSFVAKEQFHATIQKP